MLEKNPIDISRQEAGRIAADVLTVGEEEFDQAEALFRQGYIVAAIEAFTRLREQYPTS